jgi:DNA recombination protein Rad52
MTFTASQVRKLQSKLKPRHVKTREVDGLSLSYLEGWHVVAEANRIFGFDGWDRETISSECVWTKQVNGRYCAAYVTRMRIKVRAGDAIIVREGSGAGESSAATPGQAHEFASKAAETDATKRALITFGNAFGLSLYGGTPDARSGAEDPAHVSPTEGEPDAASTAKAGDHRAGIELKPAGLIPEGAQTPAPTDVAAPPAAQASLPVTQPGPDWPNIQPLDEAELLNRERVDKSALALSEPRRIRDLGHLAYVASKPCLVCGRNRTHAHHLKFAQPTALGRKVSDEFTVPLCTAHHRELHQHGDERVWWAARGIDALSVAEELWRARRKSRTASETATTSSS